LIGILLVLGILQNNENSSGIFQNKMESCIMMLADRYSAHLKKIPQQNVKLKRNCTNRCSSCIISPARNLSKIINITSTVPTSVK
jgi:hypothetical protein